MEIFFLSKELVIFESFLLAFMITYISTPSIVEVARIKHLYDEPNGRTSHLETTPTLGGLAIFTGFIISSMIFVNISKIAYIQYVIAGLIVIFFLGLKDDIVGLSPAKKFVGQIIAASIVIDLGNIRLSGLYGLAGIHGIGYYSSDFLSLFVIIAIINAVNLIDGIDGLASGVGMLAALTFGTWFYMIGEYQLTIVAFALTGGLLAFFRYNVFSKKYKLFMGDIGSLILGFMLSIFAIKFIELSRTPEVVNSDYYIKAAPAVAIGILIVPIFDTLRVMMIRIYKGRSPFKPDKRHVHHYLLELTGSHRKTTTIILSVNVFFIILSFILSGLRIISLAVIIFAIATLLTYIPYHLLKKRRQKNIIKQKKAFTADTD
jgi:UDP-N-acetylmuramyl pentapeptide phosphotransferase/UDP-N-acetylglucosamine-1-phosphate transferase